MSILFDNNYPGAEDERRERQQSEERKIVEKSDLVAEIRDQLEAAQHRLAVAQNLIEALRQTSRNRAEAIERLESDLAAAQQRITEMETESRRANAILVARDRGLVPVFNALRAIYPVYRAAVGWHYNRNSSAVLSEEIVRQHVASNQPDIIAALKAAGLETT